MFAFEVLVANAILYMQVSVATFNNSTPWTPWNRDLLDK